jgi:3alpha(or 20beta)-hydroxysteroid dehydrogenase
VTAPLFDLHGKLAVITGAASGIGAAVTAALARAGATVAVTDVDRRSGEVTAASLAGEGLRASFRSLDVTDEVAWTTLLNDLASQHGTFDVLVNNAGVYCGDLLCETELEDFRRMQRINVEGVFLGMKHAARVMRPRGLAGRGGSIINVASTAGLTGSIAHSAYGASKGAVRALSRQAAVEFAALGYGIRVNAVFPGIVRTAMGEGALRTFARQALADNLAAAAEAVTAAIPMQRLADPADIAGMIVFLASDAASYVTGGEFVVDGGYTAR